MPTPASVFLLDDGARYSVLYADGNLGYAVETCVPVGVTVRAFQVEASRWH
jgi:hypothetical protein